MVGHNDCEKLSVLLMVNAYGMEVDHIYNQSSIQMVSIIEQ